MEKPEIPKVKEVILKRRKSQDVSRARSASANLKSKKRGKVAYKQSFTRAEKLIKQARIRDSYELRLWRKAKKPEKKNLPPLEPKLIIALRVKKAKDIHERPMMALKLLRLSKPHSAVFLVQNRTTLELLKLTEPYVAWGFPNTEMVRDLIFKRGRAKVDGKKVALNNILIEERLGDLGIICMEDLIYEILNVTKNFKKINAFLWNFQLSAPAVGSSRKNGFGPTGDLINGTLKRLI